jgi:membrane-associated phospholipid phosphatase
MQSIRSVLKAITAGFVLIFLCMQLSAGERDTIRHQVYHVNFKVDIPVAALATATALGGLSIVRHKPPLDSMTVVQLDAGDVNRFDRSATWQDAGFAPTARSISDVTMGISQAMPFFLFLDREIRKEWAGVLILIFETQAITGNLYCWGGAVPFDRIRPMAYNEDVAWNARTDARNRNAFYSGHTSMSASASIFAAKVYCDFHPELGNKKYLVYSLAAIPPVATGFLRYKGLKHFPTDVITGLVVGAGVGFLIPHLHKKTGPNLTIVPFTGRMNGLALSYSF